LPDGTYDLTNMAATLKDWPRDFAIVDITWALSCRVCRRRAG